MKVGEEIHLASPTIWTATPSADRRRIVIQVQGSNGHYIRWEIDNDSAKALAFQLEQARRQVVS